MLRLADSRVTSAGLAHLKGMKSLTRLDLRATHVDELGAISLLTLLKTLDLSATPITDAGLEHVASMKNLETFLADEDHRRWS